MKADHRGTHNGHAKLTEAQVLAIRAAEGTQESIAFDYDVCQATVSMIRRRLAWQHLPEAPPNQENPR